MDLKIFNTLTRQVEPVSLREKSIARVYTCGPTVYNFAHIGNHRAYISADILKRALEFNGCDVEWVMNITDVDDKTIANTIKEKGADAGISDLTEFTEKFFQVFLADLQKLNINQDDISFVKVTEKIADIQLFILELLKRGYAYTAEDGSTYFSIEKYQKEFGDYAALVGSKFLEGKKTGARVAVDEYEKDNLADFALWKAHQADDAAIGWEHPVLGKGRPGWHIECTLINYLKFPHGTDIHTGGIDLIFPHHTNEIAQAQPIYKPFVRQWLHSEHILLDNKKMSKSLGNIYTLEDLENKKLSSGLDLRFLYLQSHYRTRFNINEQSLIAAKTGLANLRVEIGKLVAEKEAGRKHETEKAPSGSKANRAAFLAEFTGAINNDLNTPEALATLVKLIKSKLPAEQKLDLAFIFDEVLGLDLEKTYILPSNTHQQSMDNPEIHQLIARRDAARQAKDFKLSDQLRREIEDKGYKLLDTAEGTVVHKQ